MGNQFFQFKQFRIDQDRSAMKVTTDSCIFGAWVVEQLKQNPSPFNLLDIGAGTGLLTLMIAQSQPTVQITAVEIDEQTAEQARENTERTSWRSQIKIMNEDIKSFSVETQFDTIVSNPPFYEQDLIGPDPLKNQAHHDSALLFSDLVIQIDRLLNQKGKFYLLLPEKGMEERLEAIQKMGFFIHTLAHLHHSENHPQMRVLVEGERLPAVPMREEQIFIHQGSGDYSDRMHVLLKDYYLAF